MRKLLFLFLIFACGCSAKFSPLSFEETKSVESPEELLKNIASKHNELKTFRGLLLVKVTGGVGKAEIIKSIVYQAPDEVRLEFFLPPVNQLIVMAVHKDNFLKVYDVQKKLALEGAPTLSLSDKLFGVSLRIDELPLWISGRETGLEHEGSHSEKVLSLGDNLLLSETTTRDGRVIKTSMEATSPFKVLQHEVWDADSKLLLTISKYEYDKFSSDLPTVVNFYIPSRGLTGRIEFEDFELNPDIASFASKLFTIRYPTGTEVKEITPESAEELILK